MIPTVNFVFDTNPEGNFDKLLNGMNFFPTEIGNFLDKNTALPGSTGYRFEFAPSLRAIFKYGNPHLDTELHHVRSPRPTNYVFATGVGHSPSDWVGGNFNEKGRIPTIFELMDNRLLDDLRNRRALLLLDQSFEGYHEPWIWQYFHQHAATFRVPPSAIIYVTGNLNAVHEYTAWADAEGVEDRVKVIQAVTLDSLIIESAEECKTTFQEVIDYKIANLDNMKLYDCINKRDRQHRVLNYLLLNQFNLVDDGLISLKTDLTNHPGNIDQYGINGKSIDSAKNRLPLWIDSTPNDINEYSTYANRVLKDVYKRTWVSIVTEASYFKEEHNVFISEKTLKPIVCMQPFMIAGSRHSLSRLRELGYETFHPFIDETYDTMSDETRLLGMIIALEKLKNIEDKVSWYRSIQPILENNYNLFWRRAGISIGKELSDYYLEYFK